MPLAAAPDPSTIPRFVLNFEELAICCMLNTGLPVGIGIPGIGMADAFVAN